jgi:hypothetical protein
VGLSLFHCCGALRQQFSKTKGVRITGNWETAMKDWTEGEIRWIALETIGERYRRYRLPDAAAEAAMAMAILDRLVDGAIVLKIEGRSYRAHRARQPATPAVDEIPTSKRPRKAKG